ncbi:Beta-1,4-galactosyltransferase 6 [Willisornis vidua]|uniref:Beta-1,4-galactosyltransferase n=1 Tax=Willisornis vidua TaxID=1566151 RepID=A0ABQ9DTH3_9PASS|nr:Beta-1,4-galactosyltransferase 6 [Willisornis vidua]
MPLLRKALRVSNRSMLAFIFFFSFSSSCLYFIYVAPGIANTYLFMVQARGIMLKENVKTIGHMIRLYTNKNTTLNGTDYPEGNNSSDCVAQTTMYLPENFTYSPYQPCPEKLPYMRVEESDKSEVTTVPYRQCNYKFLMPFVYGIACSAMQLNATLIPDPVRSQKLSRVRPGGLIDVNMSEISFDEIQQLFLKDLDIEPGGHWKPKDCKPRWKVAILIPFRNRHEHLPIFFRHLIPMLQKQRLEFAFYVVEQSVSFVFCLKTGTQPFNRAMLFNVGFKEAMKDAVWDCIIFHDVDHLPENDRNYYGCGDMPRHFAAKLDKYMYILPYNEFFGGVSGLTVEQFKKINGFPNAFWGWGGEDDDLWNRVHYAGYNVTRPEGDLGKYKSIPHHHRGEVQFLGRYKLLRYSRERQYIDGLNNLVYTPKILVSRLYKNITVNLIPELAPVRDY